MSRALVVTADDFGLTRSTTNSILGAIDSGAVNAVSVIPNGDDVEYALAEWEKRKANVSLAVHINLTEGKALTGAADIPHLVDSSGAFSYSPFSLLFKTLFSTGTTRTKLKEELSLEITAQIQKVRAVVGADAPLALNAHQHVQMIPLVFEVIAELHQTSPFSSIRVCRENIFMPEIPLGAYGIQGLLRFFGLNILSIVLASRIQKEVLPVPQNVIGILTSGALTHTSVERGLAEAVRLEKTRIEIITHPGVTEVQEIYAWRGDQAWHASPWRKQEQGLVQHSSFKTLVASFKEGSFTHSPSHFLQVARYVCAGGTVALVSVLAVYFFTDIVGLWYIGSAVCASAISVMLSFVLQKFWTFSKRGHKDTVRELVLFFGNTFLNFITNLVLLYLLVEYAGVWYVGAQVIALCVIAVLNFFMYRYVIFPKRTPLHV